MRLTGVRAIRGEQAALYLCIEFRANGVGAVITRAAPEEWPSWSRSEKVEWAKGEIAAYLTNHILTPPGEVVFPDASLADDAKDGFEDLPGWATWTPAEAEAWIDANVTDLATAKQVLGRLAAAVLYLRDIVIES